MNTENILNRAYAQWIKDGIFEIGLGILFAGVGTLRAIIHFAPAKSAAYYWLSAGILVFMLGCGFGFNRIGKALKARISYPRTGYTAFKPLKLNYKSLIPLFILAAILGGMLGILASQPDQQQAGTYVPITLGIVGALAFSFAAKRVEVKRIYFLAAISVGIGLVISSLGIGVVLGLSFFYLGIGLAMIVTGGVVLAQYLRSHEPVDLNRESQ